MLQHCTCRSVSVCVIYHLKHFLCDVYVLPAAEDRNFVLFNFVNEQNTQVEALKDEIRKVSQNVFSLF